MTKELSEQEKQQACTIAQKIHDLAAAKAEIAPYQERIKALENGCFCISPRNGIFQELSFI